MTLFSGLILVYTINNLFLIWASIGYRDKERKRLNGFPKVSIQLVNNEKEIISCLIDSASIFEYSNDSLEILILDDSTDETSRLIDEKSSKAIQPKAFQTGLTSDRLNYHFDVDDHRSAFRDDWCTPDTWDHYTEIHPYAISSSEMVIGGPIASQAAEYFNDFTDAMVFTGYGEGFYAQGCWARTIQDHYQGKILNDVVDDELWYSSPTVEDTVGYSIVSTYKDLNGTVGFMVYGYTAKDTYYICYALRGGLLPWLQQIQCGSTTIILEIDYNELHPVAFHVKEVLGTITECTGFYTNFKDAEYSYNKDQALMSVEAEASSLGLCYKLVDIDWCAQLHPDP